MVREIQEGKQTFRVMFAIGVMLLSMLVVVLYALVTGGSVR